MAAGKKTIKNKRIPVKMIIDTPLGPRFVSGIAIVTHDKNGKTLSLCYGSIQMVIDFEQIEKYLE